MPFQDVGRDNGSRPAAFSQVGVGGMNEVFPGTGEMFDLHVALPGTVEDLVDHNSSNSRSSVGNRRT